MPLMGFETTIPVLEVMCESSLPVASAMYWLLSPCFLKYLHSVLDGNKAQPIKYTGIRELIENSKGKVKSLCLTN
jgi:hypothetical protein